MSDNKFKVDQQRRNLVKGLVAATVASSVMPGTLFAAGRGPTAVVIGAGIAGLSAAWDLRNAGFQVSILEKEEFSGGRMTELQMGPIHGPNHAEGVFNANKEMFALGAELGIENQVRGETYDRVWNPDDGLGLDNGLGLYDPGGISDFDIETTLKIPGLSAETIKKLPLLQADMDEIAATVDPCLLETGTAYDNESVGDYYERMLGKTAGREIVSYKIETTCAGWGWAPYTTSKIALLSWLASKEQFVYPRGGIGALPRKLDSLLPVQNNITVRFITPRDSSGRHTVHYLDEKLERRSVTPDVVVCAVEGKYLDTMVQGLTPKQQALTKNCFFTKQPVVYWILDEAHAPKAFKSGAYTASHPDPKKARTYHWMAMPGSSEQPPYVRLSLSTRHTPEWQNSDTAIEDYCWPLITHHYPQVEKSHVVDIVDHTSDSLIHMPAGYVSRMAEVLREQRKGRKGLYLAGEYVSGAHTGAACASGRSVARDIVDHWKHV
jgi:oxygen-dependent protoporphyrinogen oxidase